VGGSAGERPVPLVLGGAAVLDRLTGLVRERANRSGLATWGLAIELCPNRVPAVQVIRQPFGANFAIIGVGREFVPFEERWANLALGYINPHFRFG
jgi:hypothetical protein